MIAFTFFVLFTVKIIVIGLLIYFLFGNKSLIVKVIFFPLWLTYTILLWIFGTFFDIFREQFTIVYS